MSVKLVSITEWGNTIVIESVWRMKAFAFAVLQTWWGNIQYLGKNHKRAAAHSKGCIFNHPAVVGPPERVGGANATG